MKDFEGRLVREVRLDGFHAKGHKCNVKAVEDPKIDSLGAGQLWSGLDKLHFATGTPGPITGSS